MYKVAYPKYKSGAGVVQEVKEKLTYGKTHVYRNTTLNQIKLTKFLITMKSVQLIQWLHCTDASAFEN